MRAILINLPAACLAAACLAGGCRGGGEADLHRRLQAEDPAVRISAIMEAADRGDESGLALMVERLNDSESDVRFFAAAALRRMTGQDMGYRPYAEPAARNEAVARWRIWLAERGKSKGADK